MLGPGAIKLEAGGGELPCGMKDRSGVVAMRALPSLSSFVRAPSRYFPTVRAAYASFDRRMITTDSPPEHENARPTVHPTKISVPIS